ncbi:MAG: hypothetical protein P4K98_13225 [Bryobacteraceae bacterium]|nr:hypothetical protein [Bryobacteraceae bacterium]
MIGNNSRMQREPNDTPLAASDDDFWNESTQWACANILISLAGRAAERRCRQGGEPGWRRFRSIAEVKAHHEAGHAVIAAVLWNDAVLYLDIIERPDLDRGGICVHAKPGSQLTREEVLANCETKLPGDYRTALLLCSLLAPGSGWQATLRVARLLRTEADRLTNVHWLRIAELGAELARCGEMGQHEIERFLPRTMGAADSTLEPAVAVCGATGASKMTTATNAATWQRRAPWGQPGAPGTAIAKHDGHAVQKRRIEAQPTLFSPLRMACLRTD